MRAKTQEWVLQRGMVQFGTDPELFFMQDGRVVGSEKVLTTPTGALSCPLGGYDEAGAERYAKLYNNRASYFNEAAVVQDGVQLELNPKPHACRANLGNEISKSMQSLKKHLTALAKEGKKFEVSFRSMVEVDEEEFATLSERARTLGCKPSFNYYDKKATIEVNGVYRTRSAGGHIHLGLQNGGGLFQHRMRLVPLMDIIVGNTCVLIDRDPYAAERRKVYGRAGEYRLPKHGLEYRTLSNFWMHSYQLFSLVTGLSRIASDVLNTTLSSRFDAEKKLLEMVDLQRVREAINQNDPVLAQQNYERVREFIAEHQSLADSGLHADYLDAFDYFVMRVQQEGLKYWFPEDPFTHWCTKPEGHGTGWESFIEKIKSDIVRLFMEGVRNGSTTLARPVVGRGAEQDAQVPQEQQALHTADAVPIVAGMEKVPTATTRATPRQFNRNKLGQFASAIHD